MSDDLDEIDRIRIRNRMQAAAGKTEYGPVEAGEARMQSAAEAFDALMQDAIYHGLFNSKPNTRSHMREAFLYHMRKAGETGSDIDPIGFIRSQSCDKCRGTGVAFNPDFAPAGGEAFESGNMGKHYPCSACEFGRDVKAAWGAIYEANADNPLARAATTGVERSAVEEKEEIENKMCRKIAKLGLPSDDPEIRARQVAVEMYKSMAEIIRPLTRIGRKRDA